MPQAKQKKYYLIFINAEGDDFDLNKRFSSLVAESLHGDALKEYCLSYNTAESLTFLADQYFWGNGMPKDSEKGLFYLESAAEKGDEVSLIRLATYYENGIFVEQCIDKALYYFEKLADMGNTHAIFSITVLCAVFCKESEWLKRAVENNNSDAIRFLAGEAIKKGDAQKGVELIRKAIALGNTEAIFTLGDCYKYGCGVKKSEKEAFLLYLQAAEKGVIYAIRSVVEGYINGIGTEIDVEKAVEWLKRGVEKNHLWSEFTLESYDRNGYFLQEDEFEGYLETRLTDD